MNMQQHNNNTIGQITVKIENNTKMKMCSLGMPKIKTLGILTVNCNTLVSKEADGL